MAVMSRDVVAIPDADAACALAEKGMPKREPLRPLRIPLALDETVQGAARYTATTEGQVLGVGLLTFVAAFVVWSLGV